MSGIERTEARRATTIAAMSPEAKQEANTLGLSDNQNALLQIARAKGAVAQVQKARELAEKNPSRKQTAEQEFAALNKVWQRCRPSVRQQFLTDVIKITRTKKQVATTRLRKRACR